MTPNRTAPPAHWSFAQAGPVGPPGPVAIDIFLSYSRQDAEAMRAVCEVLRRHRLSVWTDDGLEPGTPNWAAAIQEAIEQAQAVVVLLSPAAKVSVWVNREIAYAEAQRKLIFPLLVAGDTASATPISLITTQWIDGRRDVGAAAQRLPTLISLHERFAPRRLKGGRLRRSMRG